MQFTEQDLTDAVASGIFTAEAVEQFRNRVAVTEQDASGAEHERFRLVGGYSDVFATIACLLILISLPVIIAEDKDEFSLLASVITLLAGCGMAEQFVRRNRFALTGIVLIGAMFISFTGIVFNLASGTDVSAMLKHMNTNTLYGWQLLFIGAGAIPLGWGLWQRYRVPVTAAVTSLTLALCVMTYAGDVLPNREEWLLWWLMLVLGLFVFAGAMCLDRRDMARRTAISDVAFWMHLLAAPMLTHPAFVWMGIFDDLEPTYNLLSVSFFFLVIILVSILIDRRGLIVSSLFYVLFVFTMFLESSMPMAPHHFSVVTLLVGVLLMFLSALWGGFRRLVLGFCPVSLRRHLRPAE